MKFTHNLLAATILFSLFGSGVSQKCFDQGKKNYSLAWAAQGATFFDDWHFDEVDLTFGAVRYVGREEGVKEGLAQAFGSHAIVRPGSVERDSTGARRKSLRLTTEKNWTYFLAAMKFSHTPFGCGVWPAFWSDGASGNWPHTGELDLLEYWNLGQSKISFHTAISEKDGCKLDRAQLKKEGCPQFDDMNNDPKSPFAYDCQTNYSLNPGRLGCAPQLPGTQKTGEQYANNPGVIAAEWTKGFIKVFYIPEAEIPADLALGAPKPDTWDKYIVSYYPFAASEKANPGSCNLNGQGVSSPQHFILNIELCGGPGGLEFPYMCNGPSFCHNKAYAGKGDCCTQYMTNERKSSKALADNAFFNISYIKVWQEAEEQATKIVV